MRNLGIDSIADIHALTMHEYKLRVKAAQYKRLDDEYRMHKQAFLNNAVTATEEKGKRIVPVYRKFEDFFNYEKLEKKLNETYAPKERKLSRFESLILQANSQRGGKNE